MALEGTLRDFSLPDIFQLIGIQRKTGILTLKHAGELVTVSFVEGSVVAADSLRKRIDDQLGNVLVKTGHITEPRLLEALKIQRNTLQRLGKVLVEHHFIAPEELKEALQLQVNQVIYRLFRWKDGEYHFSQEARVEYDRENITPVSAENILMEGVRMVDEWPIIEKKIRSTEMVFRKVELDTPVEIDESATLSEEDMAFGGAEDEKESKPGAGADLASTIRLSREDGRIYTLVDGRLSVQGIVERSRMGDFEVCKILYELLNRNLIIEASAAASQAQARGRAQARAGAPVVPVALLALACVAALVHMARSPMPLWPLAGAESETWSQLRSCISRTQIERLGFAVKVYYLAFGVPPATLDSLLTEGLVGRRDLVDPWERPFTYRPMETGFIIAGYDAAGEASPDLTLTASLPAAGVVKASDSSAPPPAPGATETIELPAGPTIGGPNR